MVRHRETEITGIKKKVDTHKSLETGSTAHHAGTHGEAPGSASRQKGRGKGGQEGFLCFPWEGTGEAA